MKRRYHQSLREFATSRHSRARNLLVDNLGKIEVKWQKAILLPRTRTSAEHVVSLKKGIHLIQSIQLLPEADVQSIGESTSWPMWQYQPKRTEKIDVIEACCELAGQDITSKHKSLHRLRAEVEFIPECGECDSDETRIHRRLDYARRVCAKSSAIPVASSLVKLPRMSVARH